MSRSRAGSALLALTGACAAFALFVGLTGGIDARLAGIPVRSRSWERPATLAAVLGVLCLIHFRHEIRRALAQLPPVYVSVGRRAWFAVPALAVVWAFSAGLIFGTFAVGGADSSGYVSQAALFAGGRLTDPMPLNPAFTWPDVPWTLTPLGYVPNRARRVFAPVYPPGFPLMMAPFARLHSRAVFVVVPICAALAVWCCWRLGSAIGEPLAGRLGAVLLSLSPTFLYQAVQPMSDVPATACWMAALLLARSGRAWRAGAAGLVAGLACLVRPNLAPLGVFVVAAAGTVRDRSRLHRAALCAASMIPAFVLLGVVQYVRYGSTFGSGYGSFEDLFALANIRPNLARYPRWLTETHTPFIWIWLLAPMWLIRAAPPVKAFGWICFAFSAAVLAAYLPYIYFRPDEWFYTRFLLPALPMMLLLGVVTTLHIARKLAPGREQLVTTLLCVGLGSWFLVRASSVDAFQVRDGEQKYPRVAAYVREHLSESAFILSMQHSGSIRYYTRRPILRWDVLDRAWLDRAVSSLRTAGYEPFVVVDVDEDAAFRERFAATSQSSLERLVVIETIGHTTVYGFR